MSLSDGEGEEKRRNDKYGINQGSRFSGSSPEKTPCNFARALTETKFVYSNAPKHEIEAELIERQDGAAAAVAAASLNRKGKVMSEGEESESSA
ncbi:hypothetical protein K0M31_000756 [Melipona bicolor]|uniref:Uncharacterized protein n=1 Tax=Melipona bicolor TaxID=60889 RepID=A0AA40KX13_9HYME|nr:hypothetical protein K0M31_000756 [Melipona bicolor]